MLAMSKRKTLALDDVPEEIKFQMLSTSAKSYSVGFLGEKARMMEQSVYRMLDRLELDAKEYRHIVEK
jgi:hypothetical protein